MALPRFLWCLAPLLLLLLSACSGPSTPRVYRVGFAQCSTAGTWRQAVSAGMERELNFHPELQLRVMDARDNSQRQQQQIRQLLREGIDLLIVSPYESASLTPVIEEVYQRGIPVVLLDRRINSDHYTAFVGGDNLDVGRTAARYAARLLHERGGVIEILGAARSPTTINRHKGFSQALAAFPAMPLVAQIDGDWNQKGLQLPLAKALQAHPETTLIFAHNDRMGQGAAEVLRRLGRTRQVRIIGVDGLEPVLVQQGELTASLLFPPAGEDAIRTAASILNHQPFKRENILGTMVIDSTNAATMRHQVGRMMSQQHDIERQQQLLQRLQHTYAAQQTALYGLLASLIGALALGAVAWRSARHNRQINRQLALQNAENDNINRELASQNQENDRINRQLVSQNAENDRINRQLLLQNEEIRAQRNQLEALAQQAQADTEAKLRFFTNLSHELRTPLTLILGPVEELLTSGAVLSEAQRQDLALVRRNTQRLLQLVAQLLDFRKMEVGKTAVRATQGDLVGFVREIVELFEKPAQLRGVELRLVSPEPQLVAWFDGNILDKVFFNLLSNAVKFTPDRGTITISLQPAEGGRAVAVSIADTGRGISEQDRAHIFEWFYQGEPAAGAKGSGIGLALAHGLVRLHQGQLTFSSLAGKGSTFTVTLPRELPAELLASHATEAAPGLHEPADALVELLPAAETPASADSETLVLVIEDNQEVNDFLVRKLGADFRVQSATDGHTGFRLATELLPDLVVCDVMMPGLSGLQVVQQLRADWRTSHIPVILLTARGAAEQQVEGVQAGADVYLTKPFNPAFLLESVRTLLANRARQREHFRREFRLDEPALTPDEQFVVNLTATVEAHLNDASLGVEDVARLLGLTRMQLYRKVKALLGTGVTEFIQGRRLVKAAELLLDESRSITDVAYELGYSTPSYFSSSFRARYNLSPSEYRSQHTAQ
ncbi:substrate-binding domain-containing protein [Hymenobacter sp. 15J16-1T3B]|uniref:substrate-binding domain-containing protein n=1 Tax=Hymenobacter sp. 15J16-1T3B TaxID=2886941 RepID=UPI001D10F9F7|nr:substrate-binding domain-containing protein [Hymenobacter sp. 15J16-1T3B]MCC3160670.1 substrate-binding domain-containing protein [Hymenobacter sp. 15J16-1T3B]